MVYCGSPVCRVTARCGSMPEAQAPAGTVQIPCQRAEPDTSDRPAVPHSASIGQPAVPRSTTISAHGGNRTQIPSEHRPRSNPPCKEFPVPDLPTHPKRFLLIGKLLDASIERRVLVLLLESVPIDVIIEIKRTGGRRTPLWSPGRRWNALCG